MAGLSQDGDRVAPPVTHRHRHALGAGRRDDLQ